MLSICRQIWAGGIQTRLCALTSIGLLLGAVVLVVNATGLQLKAALAQRLIQNAWQQTLENNGTPTRPWPWADTTPVARLQLDAAALDTWVLEGSSGTSLAFGPGMASGSASPGSDGVIVIGAHRDTHFRHLQSAIVGDTIKLQDANKQWHHYRITSITVADTRTDRIVVPQHGSHLMLVTCYPFNAIVPGGPLRYVLDAQLESPFT